DLIVASVAALSRTDGRRLARYRPEYFKVVFVDEAHHAVAPSYQRILKHFNIPCGLPGRQPLLWGCSATVFRTDKKVLGEVFDEVVFHRDPKQMINEGWLCKPDVLDIRTHVDISQVSIQHGEFQTSKLSNVINIKSRNSLIVKTYLEKAASTRKTTLVYAASRAHVLALRNAFCYAGIHTAHITGDMAYQKRAAVLNSFRSGKLPVLVNCEIFVEGTDIPRVDCIILARPTRSAGLVQQMIGRGMRTSAEKKDCLVLDF
ncbi:P-loop containing nucleoside triphosphate hydrolase protein, partial [Thamnocephalis sphaerospora]